MFFQNNGIQQPARILESGVISKQATFVENDPELRSYDFAFLNYPKTISYDVKGWIFFLY